MRRTLAVQKRQSSTPSRATLWHGTPVVALAILLGSIMMQSVNSAEAQDDPLARYRWKARVLVVLAADLGSPAVAQQKDQVESMGVGAAERGLVLVQLQAGSAEARALRTRPGLDEEPFQAVLVGKDGGAKLRAAKPITARELTATIDAIPMRQDEMRQRPCSP